MQKFFNECVEVGRLLTGHPNVVRFAIVGSVLCVGDAAKDLDILVQVRPSGDSDAPAIRWFAGSDWTLCSEEYDFGSDTINWCALRKGDVNLIATEDTGWYDRLLLASDVCAALKLKDKGDRIVVHRVIRDGYSPEAANQRRDGSL